MNGHPPSAGIRPSLQSASLLRHAAILALFPWLTACVVRTSNPPIERTDLSKGYYFHTHVRPKNSADTLFILCFSGGGTRAAALSYGVLEELRRTTVRRADGDHRLLDEVDAISSVSGGSITAAAYALYGDEIFDRLETSFLKRDVQRELLGRTLNPFRWGRVLSRGYGRSDLAADLYDEILFGGATFADLARQPGAYVIINATDIASGARFSFTQYQFDLLCTDLAPVRVSQAVAASSAVPGLLSPVTLNNHAGRCGSDLAQAIAEAASPDARDIASRARYHFLEMATYLNPTNHPYIHLVDGGVSDNLGIRAVLDGIYAVENSAPARKRFNLEAVRRIAIVVVNAYSKPDTGWARSEFGPGTLALAVAGATIPMDRYSYETIELLKEQIERWKERQHREHVKRGEIHSESDGPSPDDIEFYPVVVSFADLKDADERHYFLNQPTSFVLPDTAVDRLRTVGGRLLRESRTFTDFTRDLGVVRTRATRLPIPASPASAQ